MTLPNAQPHNPQPHNAPSIGEPRGHGADVVRGNNGANTDALTHALRQSFQATVEEAVPDSLMDLIAKLK